MKTIELYIKEIHLLVKRSMHNYVGKRIVLDTKRIVIYVLFSVSHYTQFENRSTNENFSRSSRTLPSNNTTG